MTKRPTYRITTAALTGDALVMYADTDEDARPWVRMLECAGVAVARTPNGAYRFTFAGHPELTGSDAPANSPLLLLARLRAVDPEIQPMILDVLDKMLRYHGIYTEETPAIGERGEEQK